MILLAVAAGLFLVWKRFRLWLNPGEPMVTAPARVVSVQSTLSSDVLGETIQERKTRSHFYATFARDDGTQKEYKVSRLMYETLKRGDKGLLTVKGLRFVRFVKEQAS